MRRSGAETYDNDWRRSMKLKLVSASALALALAFIGASAASAQTAIPVHQYTVLAIDIGST
jgi:hypothetical protein